MFPSLAFRSRIPAVLWQRPSTSRYHCPIHRCDYYRRAILGSPELTARYAAPGQGTPVFVCSPHGSRAMMRQGPAMATPIKRNDHKSVRCDILRAPSSWLSFHLGLAFRVEGTRINLPSQAIATSLFNLRNPPPRACP